MFSHTTRHRRVQLNERKRNDSLLTFTGPDTSSKLFLIWSSDLEFDSERPSNITPTTGRVGEGAFFDITAPEGKYGAAEVLADLTLLIGIDRGAVTGDTNPADVGSPPLKSVERVGDRVDALADLTAALLGGIVCISGNGPLGVLDVGDDGFPCRTKPESSTSRSSVYASNASTVRTEGECRSDGARMYGVALGLGNGEALGRMDALLDNALGLRAVGDDWGTSDTVVATLATESTQAGAGVLLMVMVVDSDAGAALSDLLGNLDARESGDVSTGCIRGSAVIDALSGVLFATACIRLALLDR